MLMQRNFHSKYVIEKLNKIVAMLCGLGNHFVILFDLYNCTLPTPSDGSSSHCLWQGELKSDDSK
jgi:hypothetical protein